MADLPLAIVAVMVTVPGAFAVIKPEEETVAMLLFELLYFGCSTVLYGLTEMLTCRFSPTVSASLLRETTTLTAAGPTLTLQTSFR